MSDDREKFLRSVRLEILKETKGEISMEWVEKWLVKAWDIARAMPSGPWRERWYGSEPQRGWSIVEGREVIACLGPEVSSEAVTAIVYAHNTGVLDPIVPKQENGPESEALSR